MPRSTRTDALFHAVAHPARRRILDLLGDAELPATQIAGRFRRRMTQPALSQHLQVLREVGLVAQRRSGRLRLYRATPAPLREIHDWVRHYSRFWDERLERLRTHLDATNTGHVARSEGE